uniref:Peroxisomal biogenesis factor 3 n=1 Tax=Cacopsylla melanoneura TaxID=428564 RepID=A0A8D8LKZ6_9HEMI
MLSKLANFVSNRKKTFVFLGLCFGGYKLAQTSYVQNYLLQWWQQNYLEKFEKQEVFKFINSKSQETIKKFQVNVFEKISEIFAAEELLESYKTASSRDEKLKIWDNLRLVTLSQIATVLYANVMFILGVRVHFGVTVSYKYCDQKKSTDIDSIHLNCIANFIENSLHELCAFIKTKMTAIVSGIPLKSQFTFLNLKQLFYNFQTSMCLDHNNPIRNMKHYFYEDCSKNEIPFPNTDNQFSAMINEAGCFLNSDEVISLATSLVSKSFHVFLADISSDSDFSEMATGLSFLKIIPKLCNRLNSKYFEEILLNSISSEDTVQTLSANVFEAFCT